MDPETLRALGPWGAVVIVVIVGLVAYARAHRHYHVTLDVTVQRRNAAAKGGRMAQKPPGDFNDGQTDHCWDAAGRWYMCSQWTDQGGGVQVWRYDGEGKGEQGTGWTRVLHVPNPEGYYCHGFADAMQVGRRKVCYRSQDKQTIIGDDIPGFAEFEPLGSA